MRKQSIIFGGELLETKLEQQETHEEVSIDSDEENAETDSVTRQTKVNILKSSEAWEKDKADYAANFIKDIASNYREKQRVQNSLQNQSQTSDQEEKIPYQCQGDFFFKIKLL